MDEMTSFDRQIEMADREELISWLYECSAKADAYDKLMAERENPKPLTLAEFKEMEGEAVWIEWRDKDIKAPIHKGWALFEGCDGKQYRFIHSDRSVLGYYGDNYGTAWQAYAHKPKED